MKNAHYRAQACRAMLNSKHISEIHQHRHYIDYKLQDIILMLSEESQWQLLKYHVQSQPQRFFSVLEKSFEMGNSMMRYTQSYRE